DLDPVPGIGWPQIRQVALVARDALADLGLTGWPKTSGSRGMHIYARIEPRWVFTDVRRAAVALAREIERRAPQDATSKWWKEERHGVFVDYNQNAKDRTVASGYSVRPTPDARVSAPLAWDEVPECRLEDFTIDTVPGRFARHGDPWSGIDAAVGSLEPLLELAVRDDFRCTGAVEGERLAWEQQIPGTPFERHLRRYAVEVGLEAEGEGTAVTLTVAQTLRGLSRLGGPMMRRGQGAVLDEALDGLERALT